MNEQLIINLINEKLNLNNEKLHYAFLFLSKKPICIAMGTNNFITNKTCTTIHAEISALEKIKKWKVCPKNIDLVVIKIKKNGDIGDGKPCEHCIYMLSISKIKITNVFYSSHNINTNTKYCIIKEKFSKMQNFDKNNKKIMSKSPRYKCGDKIYQKF